MRYELLLAHGGVHLGLDVECFRNIEDLLDGLPAFTAREDGFRAGTGLFGCVPGHPFLAAVVAALPDALAWHAGRSSPEQTGPELLTRVLVEQDALGREVPAVFGSELFYPYHWTRKAAPAGPDLPRRLCRPPLGRVLASAGGREGDRRIVFPQPHPGAGL